MRILIAFAVVSIILCFGSTNVSFGQGLDPLPTGGTCNKCPSVPSVGRLGDFGPGRADLSISRPPVNREPRVMTSGPLAPSDQDRADHATFLTQPSTGLIRLLPRQNPGSSF